jgi:zinc transporter 1/2/3
MPHNWPFFVTLGGYLLIFFVEKIAFNAHGLMEGDGHGHHHYDASDLDTSESKNGGKAKAVASPSHAAPANTGACSSRRAMPCHSFSATPRLLSVFCGASGWADRVSGRVVFLPGRSAVILLFALAIHSIFETMALGLSDTPLQATLLATSIALHQPAESIALLVAFLKSGMPRPEIVRYLSAFSVVGSIGVILGRSAALPQAAACAAHQIINSQPALR